MLGRCLLACQLSTCAGLLAEDRRWSPATLFTSRADPPASPSCDRQYDFLLSKSRLTYSNLGGAGPDVGRPRGILFSSVFEKAGQNIDMAIATRMPYYAHNVSANRIHGEFLGVSIDDGSTAVLLINFIDPRSNTPVKIPRLTMTLADLNAPTVGGGAKSVNVSGVHSYQTHPHTTLRTTSENGVLTIAGTSPDASNPPLFAKDMDTDALQKAVSLEFHDVDMISINLSAASGNASRVFHIGGMSNLVCPSQATCDTLTCPDFYSLIKAPEETYCDGPACNADDYATCCEPVVPPLCKIENLLMFQRNSIAYSNLGGLGPDSDSPPEIRYSNVFPASGSEVDLLITNTSTYIPAELADNGIYGHRARISVAAGSDVELKFSLQHKSGPLEDFFQNGFYFTVFDLDQEADGGGVMRVRASDFSSYLLANETLIAAHADDEGNTLFSPTEHTNVMPASTADLNLSRTDMEKEISFEYPPGHRSFDMTFSVSHGQESHAFLFTGYSTLPCPAQATCRKYECPANMEQKPNRNSILCHASECSAIDQPTCCELSRPPANPAKCDTFNCPGQSRLKPFASNLTCKWDECMAEDEDTCCIFYEADACSPAKQLVLKNLAYSNLGGAGPDFNQPAGLVYQDVFPGSSAKIDLRVTAAQPQVYKNAVADSRQNGLVGALGSISIPLGESMLFNFTFLEHGTKKQVKDIWPYTITLVGLDAGVNGAAQQAVSFPDGIKKYTLTDFSNIEMSGGKRHPRFVASHSPRDPFEPKSHGLHPYSLTPEDLESSVIVMMDKTKFQMGMSVSSLWSKLGPHAKKRKHEDNRPRTRGNIARTFLFAGASSMACSQMTPCTSYACPAGYAHKTSAPWTVCQGAICDELDLGTCCDCDDVDALKFATDSLVASTFAEGLSGTATLTNVFPNSGNNVTMHVSTVGEYYANNGSATGLDGEFLSMNIKSGAEEEFRFNFSLPSGEPYVAPSFFFSVFDLDRQRDGGGMESVWVTNTAYHRLTEPSAVVYNTDLDAYFGSVRGSFEDNPSNPLSLTSNHLKHSIAFLMKPGISEFTLGTSVTSGWTGRNIMLGGSSNIVCPERALCTKASCPSGMKLHEHAARMVCKHHICLTEDVPTCCVDARPSGAASAVAGLGGHR